MCHFYKDITLCSFCQHMNPLKLFQELFQECLNHLGIDFRCTSDCLTTVGYIRQGTLGSTVPYGRWWIHGIEACRECQSWQVCGFQWLNHRAGGHLNTIRSGTRHLSMAPSCMSKASGISEAPRAEHEQQTCTASLHLAFSCLLHLSNESTKSN